MGSLELDTTEWLHFHFSLSCIGEGNGNPLQCSCLENPREGKPGWLPSMGSHRVRYDWSDAAAAAAHIHFNPFSWRPKVFIYLQLVDGKGSHDGWPFKINKTKWARIKVRTMTLRGESSWVSSLKGKEWPVVLWQEAVIHSNGLIWRVYEGYFPPNSWLLQFLCLIFEHVLSAGHCTSVYE